jgi:DNA primase
MLNIEKHIVKEVDPQTYYLREINYSGENNKIYCPFHKESKPSFEIRVSDGSAYCYGCRTYVKNIVMFDMLYHKRTKQ